MAIDQYCPLHRLLMSRRTIRVEVMAIMTIIMESRVDKQHQDRRRRSCIIIQTRSSSNRRLDPVESHSHGLLQGLHPLINSHTTPLEITMAAQVPVFLADRLPMVCDNSVNENNTFIRQCTQYVRIFLNVTRLCRPATVQQSWTNQQGRDQVRLIPIILLFSCS